MPARRDILLTGATGFLGRYLLRDLLARGRRVVALVRGCPEAAKDRIAELTAWWSDQFTADLPQPLVVSADLKSAELGLDDADRRLVGRCGAVLHAAAQVAFRHSPDGEPWATNVEGTQRLLDLCHAVRISEFHHVSTAFVCGDRTDRVYEDQVECGQRFHNAYERSKYEAERLVRMARRVHATFYRPTVIVGDSLTGYTSSYHGLYPFLELADRVAEPANGSSAVRGSRCVPPRRLALRMPFTGDEPRNFVPVDWVSQAIVRLVHLPRWHGRTFHLAAKKPIRMNEVKQAAEAGLGVEGVQWIGSADLVRPSRVERAFYDHVRAYWPYLQGDPAFDCRNTRAALPWFPPPRVNQALLTRLIRFALEDRWGQRSCASRPGPAVELECADYVERFLPANAGRSALARVVGLTLVVGLDVHGPGGGQWSCQWVRGDLAGVRRGLEEGTDITYRTDVSTFAAVVRGRQTPQEAFFARRIDVKGDVEKALKLAVLLEHFVKECPYHPQVHGEAKDASPCSG